MGRFSTVEGRVHESGWGFKSPLAHQFVEGSSTPDTAGSFGRLHWSVEAFLRT